MTAAAAATARDQGAAFLKAAREGIITPTDQVRRSARITAHRRKVTVWTSNIFPHPKNLERSFE